MCIYKSGIELIMQIHHANNIRVFIIIPIIIVQDQSRERILYENNKLLWPLKYYYERLPSNGDKKEEKN